MLRESLSRPTLKAVGNDRLEMYIKGCVTKEMALLDKCKKPYTFTVLSNFGQVKKNKSERSVERYYKSSNEFHCRLIQWCAVRWLSLRAM